MARQILNFKEQEFLNKLNDVCEGRWLAQSQVAVSQLIKRRSTQVVDFVVLRRDSFPLLVFELDGKQHTTDRQKLKDGYKDKRLSAANIPVFRFTLQSIPSKAEIESLIISSINDREKMVNETRERAFLMAPEDAVDEPPGITLSFSSQDAGATSQIPTSSPTTTPSTQIPPQNGVNWIKVVAIAFLVMVVLSSFSNNPNAPVPQNIVVSAQGSSAVMKSPPPNPVTEPSPSRDNPLPCVGGQIPFATMTVRSVDEIRNFSIPAHWHLKNNSDEYAEVSIFQDKKMIGKVFVGPHQQWDMRIPATHLEFALRHTRSSCMDSFPYPQIISSMPPVTSFKNWTKVPQIELFRNGVFETSIDPGVYQVQMTTRHIGYRQ